MKKVARTSLIAVAAWLPLAASAQTAEAETDELDAAIDEIMVVGARELGAMRAEIDLAEDQVFALYNDLNEDDRYDIICKKETRIGSQIPKRVCLARMYRDARAAVAADDEEVGMIAAGRMARSQKHQRILEQKLRALAIEHPELLEAFKKRQLLAKKFEQARDTKYGK